MSRNSFSSFSFYNIFLLVTIGAMPWGVLFNNDGIEYNPLLNNISRLIPSISNYTKEIADIYNAVIFIMLITCLHLTNVNKKNIHKYFMIIYITIFVLLFCVNKYFSMMSVSYVY
ncbi:hypothetical protein PsAD26_01119 [Pseudovibrio sp. Ad26]|nr:hypothetical protein PsAD26_01119 [Pseudovibrio sp. Ad26]